MRVVCCILGAGYSYVGGLPLTKDLLTAPTIVYSKQAQQHFEAVWRDYATWQLSNPTKNPEEYLADLYHTFMQRAAPPFQWAVELVAAVLATPRGSDLAVADPRYNVRMTRPFHCLAHSAFWQLVGRTFQEVAIVTTNYDLLIERTLRHRPMKRRFGPGFYYGGLPRPQVLKGGPQPFTVRHPRRWIELAGPVPLIVTRKMHTLVQQSRSQRHCSLFCPTIPYSVVV